MPVQHDLQAEGRTPTELEGEMAPVFVDDVEVVVESEIR
jgi:hypothetical protein